MPRPSIDVVSRHVTLLSAIVAAAVVAKFGSAAVRSLPAVTAALGVAALAGGALVPWMATPLALFPVYLIPAIFLVSVGHDAFPYNVTWFALVIGLVTGSSFGRPWALPRRWRWALATWAMVVALSWPVAAAREFDWSWTVLHDHRLPVAGIRLAAYGAVLWIAYVALTHLVGLLWIDWLFSRYGGDRREPFRREVVLPLGCAVAVACILGAYQAFFDLGFISGHLWPTALRAVGTLMDANVFGMVSALWVAISVALCATWDRRWIGVGAAGLVLTIVGVWVSGSRTALLVAALGAVAGAVTLLIRAPDAGIRRRTTLAIGAVVLFGALALTAAPVKSMNALQRARYMVPEISWDAVRYNVRVLWDRDGYGSGAVAMIRSFPLTGVGVGCFTILAHDFVLERAGLQVPPDTAQNWFRQQLAELGLVGALPSLVWAALCLVALWPRRGSAGPGIVLRGAIVAFGLASMVGGAGQEPTVVLTFWLLVFWYATDDGARPSTSPMGRVATVAMIVLVAGFAALTATERDLRPAFRAARFGFPYTYGFTFDGPSSAHSAAHGVTVQTAQGPWMKLSYWVEHPDADSRLVKVEIWRDRDRVVSRRMSAQVPATVYVSTPGAGKRFVLETRVDRTWTDADARERGLAMKWEFVEKPPPGADVVQR